MKSNPKADLVIDALLMALWRRKPKNRVWQDKLNPTEALSFYLSTYIERDLRMLINLKDLQTNELNRH